ncbi:unnamed protein product [Linum tenue]|uniref:Uncharacterized protein n=1 Tax=Linum tenue TaxID=586396 RepID=A0AAV0KN42_9ROSI|nr:unnamed protein product [Linum tenue]
MQQLPSLHGGPSPDRAEPRRSSVLQLQATWVEVSLW